MRIVFFNDCHKIELDHETLFFGYEDIKKGARKIIKQIRKFKPDLIIEEEKNDGLSKFTEIYNNFPTVPKAWWCIDAHCNLIDHIVYAKQFNYVFCAQSWFLPLFVNRVNATLYWLPLCHPQSLEEYERWLLKPKPTRDIEFSFIGNIRPIHVERKQMVMGFLEQLGDRFVARTENDYDKMLDLLTRSKMTFNCSLNEDLNFRVWESLATNTPIMTDYVADICLIKDFFSKLAVIFPRVTDTRISNCFYNNPVGTSDYVKSAHTLTHRYQQMIFMILTRQQLGF